MYVQPEGMAGLSQDKPPPGKRGAVRDIFPKEPGEEGNEDSGEEETPMWFGTIAFR